MSDSNSAVLQRAFELVEAGQAEEARNLVESVLESEQSNPDAWWIYAHAIDDPVKARQALNEVLALDPEYPGVNELVSVLDRQYPEAAEAALNAPPLLLALGSAAVIAAPEAADSAEPLAEPEAFAEMQEPEPEAEAEPGFVAEVPPATVPVVVPVEQRRAIAWWWYVAAGAAALLLLVFLAALLGRPAPSGVVVTSEPDATVVAGAPTLDAAALAAQSAQETAIALGLPTLDIGEVVTSEPGVGDTTPGVPEGTSESLLPGDGGVATSEPAQPIAVATLPLESFVTLTPSSPEPVVTAEASDAVEPAATEAGSPDGAGDATTEATAGVNIPAAVVVIVPAETLNQLVGALSAFNTPPETSLTTEATPLGETLTAGFCTQDGPELRDLTRQVMDTVAAAAPVMADTTGAVGVRAMDCQTGQTLRLIVVDRSTATLYTQGEINREGFESQWISL